MSVSAVMKEIRNIRDVNSERHLKMTTEERKKEEDDVLAWFAKVSNKPLKIVSISKNSN